MKQIINHLIEHTWITEVGLRAWSVLIYRDNQISHRCGYVECKDPKAEGMDELAVHGGVTWQEGVKTAYNFGVPTIGFDCDQLRDNTIEHPHRRYDDAEVRSLPYVISECEKLAKQVHTLEQHSYSV